MRTVDGPGEYEMAGSLIEGVATYLDKQRGKTLGKNTAFLIHLDDVSVCHLGALAHTLSSSQIETLKDADVLLVPVGGGTALDACQRRRSRQPARAAHRDPDVLRHAGSSRSTQLTGSARSWPSPT